MDKQQIRINAVMGISQRQKELVKENRQLRTQAKFNDEIGGIFGFGLAIAVILFCILA
jgi:hypothetical protein